MRSSRQESLWRSSGKRHSGAPFHRIRKGAGRPARRSRQLLCDSFAAHYWLPQPVISGRNKTCVLRLCESRLPFDIRKSIDRPSQCSIPGRPATTLLQLLKLRIIPEQHFAAAAPTQPASVNQSVITTETQNTIATGNMSRSLRVFQSSEIRNTITKSFRTSETSTRVLRFG